MKKTVKFISALLFISWFFVILVSCGPDKVKIAFDSDGGSIVTTQEINKGSLAIEPSVPTKVGYEFVNWYLNDVLFEFTTPIKSNITLKAKWEEKVIKYLVTFNSNGGSGVSSAEVEKDALLSEPANPTKTGYTFKYWSLNDIEYAFTTKVTGNITLKAEWEILQYDVTFDCDGGNGVVNQKVDYNTLVIKPNDPVKEGYNFIGWFLDNIEYNFDSQITSNLNLVAKWDQIVFTLTFDSDGGSLVTSQNVIYKILLQSNLKILLKRDLSL
jgi:uncharacterized repeat protein (TIGR02543 family)